MAQVFFTTYKKSYEWHKIEKNPSLKPYDLVTESTPEGDIWLVKDATKEDINEDKFCLENRIKRMNGYRYWSTYSVSYCRNMVPDPVDVVEEEAKYDYCKKLLEPYSNKILPPLSTTRRLYGYIRPTRMYTPLTVYQNVHGKFGCQYLKRAE